jgi:integrase
MLNLSLPEPEGGFNPAQHLRRPAGLGRHRIKVLCAMGGSMKIKFTKGNIEALEPPPAGELFVWSEDKPGFGIRILASGRKSWLVQYRIRGEPKSRRHTIGDLRILPLSLADKRAGDILGHAKLGIDLLGEEKQARVRKTADAERSVKKLIEAYLAEPEVRRQRAIAEKARYLRKVWAPIHNLSAEVVSLDDLAPELAKIAAERGGVSANRAKAHLSSLFVWAIKGRHLRRQNAPAFRLLETWGETARERTLSLEELRAVWDAAAEVNETFGAIIRLLILSGARRSEISSLFWSETDLEHGLITIPGSRTKNGNPHAVPLAPAAVEILKAVPRLSDQLVFVGAPSWTRAKRKLDALLPAKLGGETPLPWTVHDIRRSCRSLWIDGEQGLGLDVHLCELMLGHALPGIIGVYDKATRLPERRRALERWAELLLGRQPGNVVELRRGAR